LTAIDELLDNARRYAEGFSHGDLPAAPQRKVAIVSCMDARIDPVAILGLDNGAAHVIRNAGGIVTDDVVRSLALSQVALGTREVMVIQHTRCGLHGIDEDEMKARMRAEAGAAPDGPLGAFADLDERVRASVTTLRESGCLMSEDHVRGFVYDVETGQLREVT
jgi:carbonic anhydrase